MSDPSCREEIEEFLREVADVADEIASDHHDRCEAAVLVRSLAAYARGCLGSLTPKRSGGESGFWRPPVGEA